MIIERINGNHNFFEKMPTTNSEYIQALEDERRKISVFQSELPLSLQLVTHVIEECKQKLLEKETQQSGCPEEANSEKAVLEEFMPLKRTYESDDDDNQQSESNMKDVRNNGNLKTSRKSDWLRSVQLWNQTPDPPPQEMESKKRLSEAKRNGNGGAFQPFKRREKTPAAADAASSKEETDGCSGGGKCNKEEKQGQSGRKIRRSWSPELHKRFTEALQQLGGSNVATPKQIRELMKVDGLSNDEVKSHLQKYRLHNKRLSPPIDNKHLQHPQFVVVGGIWVPGPEYTAMATTTISGEETKGATPNEIYAPVAKLAAATIEDASSLAKHRQQQHQLPQRDGNSSCGAGGVDSQASSLSTDTTTTSSY